MMEQPIDHTTVMDAKQLDDGIWNTFVSKSLMADANEQHSSWVTCYRQFPDLFDNFKPKSDKRLQQVLFISPI